MNETEGLGPRWLLRLQSAYVLPLARGIYLLLALGCLLAVIAGILFILYLQAATARGPALVQMPPPYRAAVPTAAVPEPGMDLGLVRTHLDPPSNIRFVVTTDALTAAPAEGTILGHFAADTPNGLAPFPDGISILGGRDADLFARVRDGAGQGIALAARPALAAEIAKALKDAKAGTSRPFEIRVVARDRFGSVSAPADISFALTLGYGPPAVPPTPDTVPEATTTELQTLARDIARLLEPEVNPAHFSAYRTALQVPGRCGADDSDRNFLEGYRRALEEVRPRLTKANVEAFYTGLCEAWKKALQRQVEAQERVQQQQRAALQAADEARYAARTRNDELRQAHEAEVAAAKVQTVVTLSVVGGALAVFLALSLLLAFLAIEGHTRAVRAAMESMVRIAEEGRSTGST